MCRWEGYGCGVDQLQRRLDRKVELLEDLHGTFTARVFIISSSAIATASGTGWSCSLTVVQLRYTLA